MSNPPRHPRTAISTCSFACRPSTVGGINRRGRDVICFSRTCGRHCCKQQITQQALTTSCCARFSHQAALSMLMSEAALRETSTLFEHPQVPPLHHQPLHCRPKRRGEADGGVLVRRELSDVGPRSRTSVCVFAHAPDLNIRPVSL